MRRVHVVDDDLHICLAIRAWLKRYGFKVVIGATRWLRKPFRPATLPGVIDEFLSEAESHRRHVATLAAVTSVVSKKSSHESREGAFAD